MCDGSFIEDLPESGLATGASEDLAPPKAFLRNAAMMIDEVDDLGENVATPAKVGEKGKIGGLRSSCLMRLESGARSPTIWGMHGITSEDMITSCCA